MKDISKRITGIFTTLINAENISIRDKFLHIILLIFSVFLLTQCFAAILYISEENVYASIICCLAISGLYFYLYKTKNYDTTRFLLFIFTFILLALLWFASEGILGAIPHFVVFSIFTFVAISEPKHHKIIVISFLLFYSVLVIFDYMFPQYIQPYNTVEGQKIDISVSVFFVSIFVAFAFNYIIRKYEEQQKVAQKEVGEQKRLNEELDSFVYRTSHDLRAPIVSALGLIQLIENAKTLEEAQMYAELQRRSMEKLDTFIIDIIHYSQNNRSEVEKQPIDFEEIFQHSIAECDKKQYALPITCKIDIEAKHVLLSDKMRLKILFDNMISNSYQFVDHTKPEHFLHIHVKNVNKDWEITFEDNGIGIEEKHINKIFDMFYRATNKTKGSGIGLYIVKQAVSKLGGTITCRSQYRVGTTIVVKLPNQSSEKIALPQIPSKYSAPLSLQLT